MSGGELGMGLGKETWTEQMAFRIYFGLEMLLGTLAGGIVSDSFFAMKIFRPIVELGNISLEVRFYCCRPSAKALYVINGF